MELGVIVHSPGHVHFAHDILIIVSPLDVNFDAIFIVSPGKHELSRHHFFSGQPFPRLITRSLEFFDPISIPTSIRCYRRVFMVFSEDEVLGETLQIMTVLQ